MKERTNICQEEAESRYSNRRSPAASSSASHRGSGWPAGGSSRCRQRWKEGNLLAARPRWSRMLLGPLLSPFLAAAGPGWGRLFLTESPVWKWSLNAPLACIVTIFFFIARFFLPSFVFTGVYPRFKNADRIKNHLQSQTNAPRHEGKLVPANHASIGGGGANLFYPLIAYLYTLKTVSAFCSLSGVNF